MRPTWDNAGRQARSNSREVLVCDDIKKTCSKHKPHSSLCRVNVHLGRDNDVRHVGANPLRVLGVLEGRQLIRPTIAANHHDRIVDPDAMSVTPRGADS